LIEEDAEDLNFWRFIVIEVNYRLNWWKMMKIWV